MGQRSPRFEDVLEDAVRMRREVDRKQHNRPPKHAHEHTAYGYETEVVVPRAGKRVPAVKRHKVRSTIDLYGKYFQLDEVHAMQLYCDDAERATRHNLTISYDGNGGGSAGPRDGGVAERNRLAHCRLVEVESRLAEVSPNGLAVLRALVLSRRYEPEGRPLTIHEVAHFFAPHLTEKKTLGSFGAGLLKATAWVLVGIYQEFHRETRPRRSAVEQAKRQRQARRQT